MLICDISKSDTANKRTKNKLSYYTYINYLKKIKTNIKKDLFPFTVYVCVYQFRKDKHNSDKSSSKHCHRGS